MLPNTWREIVRLAHKQTVSKERDRSPSHITIEEISRIAQETALEHGGHVPTLIAAGSKRAFGGQIASLPGALDWIGAVEATIKVGQVGGKIRPAADGGEDLQ